MSTSIADKLEGWGTAELANLATVLGMAPASGPIPVTTIEQQIKWAYHSQALAGAEATAKSFADKVRSSFAGTQANRIATDDTRELPSYDELLRGACKHLKVDEPGATVQEQELYLAQAVLIEAVRQMGPRQRMQFFCQPIDGSDVWARSAVPGKSWKGPATAFAAIGAAQASGFGVYLASTTALGFLTHAAGVTLPFAVYTGMTSLIAIAIGPVGCVVAGAWAVSKAVEPNWQRLVGALMCMIATNSHRAVVASP
jgi:hypothetical protein